MESEGRSHPGVPEDKAQRNFTDPDSRIMPGPGGRGFRQFLLRSLEKVNREWLLICAGHNLLKLFRFGGRLPDKVLGSGPTRNINESPGAASASILERLSGHLRLAPARIAVAN